MFAIVGIVDGFAVVFVVVVVDGDDDIIWVCRWWSRLFQKKQDKTSPLNFCVYVKNCAVAHDIALKLMMIIMIKLVS